MKSNLKIRIKNKLLEKKLVKNQKYTNLEVLDTENPVVLIVDNMIPEFDKDSGSRRLFELIKLMLKNDFTVVLMADRKEYKYKSDYIKDYRDAGVFVYEPYVTKEGRLVAKTDFIKLIAHKIDFVWLHRPEIFNTYYTFIKSTCPSATYIFDMVDFHYLRLIREWEIDHKKETLKTANYYLEMELNNCKNADRIVLISTGDKLALKSYNVDLSKAEILSNVHQHIKKESDFIPFENRKELLFIGGFQHAPNEDAVLYLHDKIMPYVWEVHPNMVVNIIGSYPTDNVLKLNSEVFKIHGFVNDVAPYFKSAKAFVAPLRYGAGIKGKIGQSLEFNLPVVTTDVGAEGFDFSPYKDIMIANDSKTFAKNVLEVISDKKVFDCLSNHAEVILKPFSIEKTEQNLLKILAK